jgi:hypothetical protein
VKEREVPSKSSGWMTVQMFLSSSSKHPAVFEVEFHTVDSALRCSCPGWRARQTCKHTAEVQEILDANGGDLPLTMLRQVTREQVREAEKDLKKFREIVLRHGQVKVI